MIKDSDGFTLLEMLVVLSGCLVIVSLMPLFMNIRWVQDQPLERLHPFEWLIFVNQVTTEVREAKEVEVNHRTLHLYKFTGEKISLEKHGQNIRRRVNGQGNEIVLQNVSNIEYRLGKMGIHLQITSQQGKKYEAFIATFFPLKVRNM